MGSRSLRARQLVVCARCGQMVSRATAAQVEGGWVGGSCLRRELATVRSMSSNTEESSR